MSKTTTLFGDNLRRLIKGSSFTYGEAAAEIDVSLTFLNQLMNGEKNPSAETLNDICATLNTTRAYLYGEPEAEKDPLPGWAGRIEATLKLIDKKYEDRLKADKDLANLDRQVRELTTTNEDLRAQLSKLSKQERELLTGWRLSKDFPECRALAAYLLLRTKESRDEALKALLQPPSRPEREVLVVIGTALSGLK